MTQQIMTEASSGDEYSRVCPLDDDLVMFKFITDKRTVAFETDLFSTKWFDYRHLTAVQATRLYIQEYENVSRVKYAANFDKRAAEHFRTVSVDWVFDGLANADAANHKKAKSHFTSCWHGRQMADLLGMPYEVYLDHAFEIRLRYWNRHYLPQPQHLYSDLVTDRIQVKWEELQAGRLYTSEHPAYLVQNYAGIRHQDDYHEWLLKQAGLRANPAELIGRFINEDALPIEKARTRTDERIFERVQQYLH